MKAICHKDHIVLGEEMSIDGDRFHHLVNVMRTKIGDELLLLDGSGRRTFCEVTSVSKKSLAVRSLKIEQVSRVVTCDVLLFFPKREALESMLKMATEMGVNSIYLFRGKYSQDKFPDPVRVEALLQSAMEQSNNPWKPEITLCPKPEDWPSHEQTILMDVAGPQPSRIDKGKKSLLVIGPEAGFSDDERVALRSRPGVIELSFPTPILRASTALPAGLGWWHGNA